MKRIWIIGIVDLIAFWLSLFFILTIRFGNILKSEIALGHLVPFIILYISWTLIFYLFGLYDIFTIKPTIPNIRRFALALATSLVIGIFLFYFAPIFGISPKTNLIFQVSGFGILSFFFRRVFYSIYSKQITKLVFFVGNKNHLDELHDAIKSNPQIGLQVVSYKENLKDILEDYPNIKNSIFIIDSSSEKISTTELLTIYKNKNEIIDIAQAYERYLYKIPVSYISQSWVIENINIKKDILYTFINRIIDIVFSISIFIITIPFTLIAVLLIYMNDKGPVFYTQDRVGINGKIFKLYKLRSMRVNAEKNGAVWASGANDPRVTPIGKVIRKLHIDEIPQMINILKGDLALIGPRPERPEFVEKLEESIPHYKLRHIIKPGFTGWAQIKYHYANTVDDSKEKFEYDLYYIKNRNIFIDFGIVFRTIIIIFTH